jgi:flagellar P-ring protein precursor FlgI
MGGTLILTPLVGGDNMTHAVAQGPLAVSGSASQGQAETLTQGVPTAGRISNGAIVEQEVATRFGNGGGVTLELKNPDFNTAVRVADAINSFTSYRYGMKAAHERDLRSVSLLVPARIGVTRFMAQIGELLVEPDTPARVIIDERTGTVVIGQDVQISTVAVTHGSLTVRVTETPQVSQPGPLSNGQTKVVPNTTINSEESGGEMVIVGGTTLRTLVRGLNQIGLKPTGIIAILQAIKSAGALQADLVTQ